MLTCTLRNWLVDFRDIRSPSSLKSWRFVNILITGVKDDGAVDPVSCCVSLFLELVSIVIENRSNGIMDLGPIFTDGDGRSCWMIFSIFSSSYHFKCYVMEDGIAEEKYDLENLCASVKIRFLNLFPFVYELPRQGPISQPANNYAPFPTRMP